MKIKGSATPSQMPPVMTPVALVSPTTPETVPPTTLLNKEPKLKHQNMNKRVNKKKRCRGEILKSWVKSRIENTPRVTKIRSTRTKARSQKITTRKGCQSKIKVPITPRQVKTCRVDQGRRKMTSGTSTTIWPLILGRGRPTEADLESLLLDRKPNKFKNIKRKGISDNLRCSKNWLSKQSRKRKRGSQLTLS